MAEETYRDAELHKSFDKILSDKDLLARFGRLLMGLYGGELVSEAVDLSLELRYSGSRHSGGGVVL